jgi:hypothetical protein
MHARAVSEVTVVLGTRDQRHLDCYELAPLN